VAAESVDLEALLNRVIDSLSVEKKRFVVESGKTNCTVQADPVGWNGYFRPCWPLPCSIGDAEHPITVAVSPGTESTCQLSIRTNKSVPDPTFQSLQQLLNGNQALSSKSFALFNAQSVLELQGGKFHLENNPEKGLGFYCYLPLAKVDAQQGSTNG
jgi:hypothetical protein